MKLKTRIFYCAAVLSAVLLGACSSSEQRNDYLVKVGDQELDSDIFIRRYKLSKDFADAPQIDQSKVKAFIDRFYVNNLLFRAEGFRLNIVEQDNVQEQIEKTKKELLTRANSPLYREVTGDIKVTDEELQQLYDNMTEEVKIAHILVGSKPLADSLYELLQNGADFNKLVEQNSLDMNTVQSDGVIPQYFTKGLLNPNMEKAIFSLNAGEYSRPVRTGVGYHVIRIIDRRAHQKGSYRNIKNELAKQLHQRKVELRFELYLQSLKEKYHYEIIDSVTALVARKYRSFSGKSRLPLDLLSPQQTDYQIAKYDGGGLPVRELIKQFNNTPLHVRGNLKTPENIIQFIDNITQVDLMYRDALERGLDKNTIYQEKLAYITGNLVQQQCQRQLVYNKVSVSDEELKRYYHEVGQEFGNRPFEEVQSLVHNKLRNNKQQQLMNEVVTMLKGRYRVSYNDRVLNEVVEKLNKMKQS